MEYKALYRKYRPVNFEEMVGQETTVEILKNSIINNKIGHAYLFSGPRGTGKTSTAKILASIINCEHPLDGNPCNKCTICKQFNSLDIIEIDAASNNGVDEIREIRSNAKLLPTMGKYKVYIIDEVHMLSIGAFNALLKTLEEPPKHVIFILATTELHKVPLTIISRCQKFEFKTLDSSLIYKRLNEIKEKEELKIDDNALKLISELSDGGLRDAINLLDQVCSVSKNVVSESDVCDVSGIVTYQENNDFLEMLVNNKINDVLKYIELLDEKGKSYLLFSERFVVFLRDLLVKKTLSLENFDKKSYIKIIYAFIELTNSLKNALNQKILFEIKMMELIDFDVEEVADTEEKNVSQTEIFEEKNIEKENDDILDNEVINDIRVNNALALANKKILMDMLHDYVNIDNFMTSKIYSKSALLLSKSKLVVASNEYLIIAVNDFSTKVSLRNNIVNIENLFEEIYGKKFKIAFLTNEEWIEEKQLYMKKIKDNIKYVVKEEPNEAVKKVRENSTFLENTVIDIFGEDNIKYNN